MCFFVHEDHPTVKIAEEDIVCYKFFKLNVYYKQYPLLHFEKYTTPYRNFSVKEKALMTADIGKISKGYMDSKVIAEGIHSCSSLKAIFFKQTDHREPITVKCFIPKGSEYYYNPEQEEYISNQLQLGEEIKYVRLQKILNFITNIFNNLK